MIVVCLSILGILLLNMITLAPSMVLFIIGILTTGLCKELRVSNTLSFLLPF